MLNNILTSGNAFLAVTNFAGAPSLQTATFLPLGTSTGTGTGELGLKTIIVGSSASFTVTTVPKGAPNYANNQVATSTTAGTLVAARATRRSVTVINTDAAITVYIGAATVTAGNGLPLKPSQSVSIDTTALIQVIAASGTPVVAYMETYD